MVVGAASHVSHGALAGGVSLVREEGKCHVHTGRAHAPVPRRWPGSQAKVYLVILGLAEGGELTAEPRLVLNDQTFR